jgi:transcriptional regulator with XRE-family HTH domain
MSQGYSVRLHRLNAAADIALVGVRLGRLCLERDISVTEAATALQVSRQTLYNWFCAKSVPSPAFRARVEEYISNLG